MAWTLDFITRISASQITPIYVLESVVGPFEIRPGGGNLFIASAPIESEDGKSSAKVILSPEGSRVSYGTLQVREWSMTVGEWSIGLLSQNLAERDIRKLTTRGQTVQLRIGFPGWGLGQYQPVALGQVQDVVRDGDGRWSIRVRGVLAALATRASTLALAQPLFALQGREAPYNPETTLSASYSPTDTEVEVATTPGYRENGGNYLLRVTPDSGEPFYLTATGVDSVPKVQFTGVSTTAILGTTAAAASTGNRVEVLAYIQDHPFNVIRKVLCSTGTLNANGAYDTLPEHWGLGFPDELVDDADCVHAVAEHTPNSAPGAVWDVYEDQEQNDALGWMQGVIAPMGGFICERQGRVLIRGSSTYFQPPNVFHSWDAYDGDIVSLDNQSTYDPSVPGEYAQFKLTDSHGDVTTLNDADGEVIDTRPATASHDVDLPFVDTDRTDWREHIRDAIGPFSTRIGEPVAWTFRGWRLAQMAPGDHLTIHTSADWLSGRNRNDGADLSDGGPLFVTSVQADWFGATTRVTGVLLPQEPQG